MKKKKHLDPGRPLGFLKQKCAVSKERLDIARTLSIAAFCNEAGVMAEESAKASE